MFMLLTRCWKEWSSTARGKLVTTLFHATSETWYMQRCHHFGVKYQTPAEEGLTAVVLSDSLWNWRAASQGFLAASWCVSPPVFAAARFSCGGGRLSWHSRDTVALKCHARKWTEQSSLGLKPQVTQTQNVELYFWHSTRWVSYLNL